MPDLLIRKVDEETKRKLAIRAAENGRSVQAEALDIITRAVNFDKPRRPFEDFAKPDLRIRSVNPILKDDSATSGFGMFREYADAAKRKREKEAWPRAAVEKYLANAAENGWEV